MGVPVVGVPIVGMPVVGGAVVGKEKGRTRTGIANRDRDTVPGMLSGRNGENQPA